MLELSKESFVETYVNGGETSQRTEFKANPDIMPSTQKKNRNRRQERTKTHTEEDMKNNNSCATSMDATSPTILSSKLSQKSNSSSQSDASESIKSSQDTTSMKRRLRKISVDKLASFGGAVQAAVSRRRKSLASEYPSMSLQVDKRTERRISHWLPLSPYLTRKTQFIASESNSADDAEDDSAKNGENRSCEAKPVFSSPSMSLVSPNSTNAVHQGFLDFRNKKKRWEKYWCVLQESCIYCYHTPQSETSRDVIVLRGYDVVADVKTLNRVRFIFHLQQQSHSNIYFSCDNHRDYLLWVGCLEREVDNLKKSSSQDEISSAKTQENASSPANRRKMAYQRRHRASLPNIRAPLSVKEIQNDQGFRTQKNIDHEFVTMQKQKLLQELAFQKKQLIEEQKLLEGLPNSLTVSDFRRIPLLRQMSKEKVIEEYEKQKIQEELRTKDFQTFLNRRRNSCHLKMAHYNKSLELSQNSASRRGDHLKFVEAEKQLKEMQQALVLIDRELEEEQATKQHNLERLERKKDLELLMMEQCETLQILRRTQSRTSVSLPRRLSYDPEMASATKNIHSTRANDDSMASLEDVKFFSTENDDQQSTSHTSLSDSPAPDRLRMDFYVGDGDDDVTTDDDSGFQASTEQLGGDGDALLLSSPKNSFTSSPKHTKVDDYRVSSSSDETMSKAGNNEIDLSILAKIEDFENFARMKLQEAKKQT